MKNILEEIAEANRKRVAEKKKEITPEEMAKRAEALPADTGFPFEKALRKEGISFICECKKASPSKGIIAEDFPYLEIAKEYEEAGASAISVLTEPIWFKGKEEYLREIAEAVEIPCVRKDFVIDEYMIDEAKVLGASAVLLICALLEESTLRNYIERCRALGLSALVEAHDEEEIKMALRCGARIIGVNNRNLKDFTVDVANGIRLRKFVPDNVLFIAESGIKTGADVRRLREAKVDAVLVGETLMRAPDKKIALDRLAGRVKVKVCGLRRKEDVLAANRLMPDYIGMIFVPGTGRFVTDEQAEELREALDERIRAVGVFAGEDPEHILRLTKAGIIDGIQLHGGESESYIQELKERTDRPVIRMVRPEDPEDIRSAGETAADYLLFDHIAAGKGGTGETFDWGILESCREEIKKPFFVAGGIGPDNAREAAVRLEPYALDASSLLETGEWKDPEKMKSYIAAVRSVRSR